MLRRDRGTGIPYRLTTTTDTESTGMGVTPPYIHYPTFEYSNFVSDFTLLCPSHVSVDSAPTLITGESFLGGSYTIVFVSILG